MTIADAQYSKNSRKMTIADAQYPKNSRKMTIADAQYSQNSCKTFIVNWQLWKYALKCLSQPVAMVLIRAENCSLKSENGDFKFVDGV